MIVFVPPRGLLIVALWLARFLAVFAEFPADALRRDHLLVGYTGVHHSAYFLLRPVMTSV